MTYRENAAVLETYLHNIRNIEEAPPGPAELEALDAAVEAMKAAVENVEYGAFAWDKQRGMFVQIGRPVPVKQLCLNRYQERARNGEIPSWIDPEKFKIWREWSQRLQATGRRQRMNKTVNLFVLAGCWECPDDIGVTVVAISSDEKQLIDRLDQIADTQAKEYVSIEGSILMEEHTDTRYEISGGISGNARFYITEEPAVINEALMGEISRAMSKNDRTEDVKNYLQGLFENGNLDEEKYEELVDSEEFLQKAVELFDKMEDCNTPFNTTMELAVGEARKEMTI